MLLIILMVVAVYSGLMVYLLAKIGCTPAKSVIDVIKESAGRSQVEKKKAYERTFSAR
ncbi:hypothetical protein [Halobacillus litoralis]|uniref:hypothetical protein n=1 Tax=Halobacillus litoralis TaxID=45668 RepID=UPI0013E8E649|nr:hypothetical protein [Halobacillus litoralis]